MVAAVGDLATRTGRSSLADCYPPTWGALRHRTRPALATATCAPPGLPATSIASDSSAGPSRTATGRGADRRLPDRRRRGRQRRGRHHHRGPGPVVLDVVQSAPNAIMCLTGVNSPAAALTSPAGDLACELVLDTDVVFGSVNASRSGGSRRVGCLLVAPTSAVTSDRDTSRRTAISRGKGKVTGRMTGASDPAWLSPVVVGYPQARSSTVRGAYMSSPASMWRNRWVRMSRL